MTSKLLLIETLHVPHKYLIFISSHNRNTSQSWSYHSPALLLSQIKTNGDNHLTVGYIADLAIQGKWQFCTTLRSHLYLTHEKTTYNSTNIHYISTLHSSFTQNDSRHLDQLLVVMIPRIAAGPHLDLKQASKSRLKINRNRQNQDILQNRPFDVVSYWDVHKIWRKHCFLFRKYALC